ncbi:MAG: cysteine--tRNA ligase [Clostridiales bacterium]|nr:MAG: cysteine--tRNA ligase [Clostridiales bacterium]
MRLFNTLTRQKEELTVRDGRVRMYACGPTVYNYIHIGNARCFVLFDLLRRYLEYRGNEVVFVQNFTDVDDKMIAKAKAEGCTVPEIAARYIDAYFTDAQGLGVRPATVHPRATENIPEIIEIVQTLIDKGHAYESNGNVYFAAGSFPHYGCLSHYNLDELEAGARIDVNDEKRHPFDFALWKAKKEEGEISWPSPWGEGRPGWHIECSAMVRKYLGTDIDIHCGGQDLTFPHHENEIAQSECATGAPLARFWLHNGYINVDNRKMSKSAGDCFWVRDAAKKFGYGAIRYFLLASHYRNPVNFSESILEQSAAALERLRNCRENLAFRLANAGDAPEAPALTAQAARILERRDDLIAEMDDDFNTANAIAVLFEITRDINTLLQNESVSAAVLRTLLGFYDELLGLFGFLPSEQSSDGDAEIEALVAERAQAKKEKNYKKADEIRARLGEMGVTLEDTPQGTKWKKA